MKTANQISTNSSVRIFGNSKVGIVTARGTVTAAVRWSTGESSLCQIADLVPCTSK